MVKELPHRTKTIRQNQWIWLRYTHYSSQSVAIVGPQTHVILPLHKRSPKITTLCGNLFVCRWHSNILYRRNDGFANKLTKWCSSWTTGMVRQIRWYHTQKNVKQWSCSKVILPSVTYGLVVWGLCKKMHLNNLVKLHARAGRIVYGLPWDTSAEDVLMRTGWDSLEQCTNCD